MYIYRIEGQRRCSKCPYRLECLVLGQTPIDTTYKKCHIRWWAKREVQKIYDEELKGLNKGDRKKVMAESLKILKDSFSLKEEENEQNGTL